MRIDEACIDHNVHGLIADMLSLSDLYDWSGPSETARNLQLVTLGEIRGICQLATALKEVLKA